MRKGFYLNKYKRLSPNTKIKIVKGVIVATLVAVTICTATDNYRSKHKETVKIEKTISIEEKQKIDVSEILIENSKAISELNVFEFQVSRLHRYTKNGLGYQKTIDVKYFYKIKHNIDLNKIDKSNIVVEDNSIKLYLSEPSIDVIQMPSMTQIGSVDGKGILNWLKADEIKVDIKEETKILDELLTEVEATAKSDEYMSEAKKHTALAIEMFLRKIGLSDYKVEVYFVR